MSLYLRVVPGGPTYPYSLGQLAIDANATLPANPSAELLEEFGVFAVEAVPMPALSIGQEASEGPPKKEGGVWRQTWITATFGEEEIANRLAALRIVTIEKINREAGAFRLRFITDIPGQPAAYLAKEQEALRWTEGADPADFPYLANEAAATGAALGQAVSLGQVAAVVLQTATSWRTLDPKVEGLRRGATVAISVAATAEAIVAAGNVNWDALLA